VPNLAANGQTVDDNVPTANYNGFVEPGEAGIRLWPAIENNGALNSTGITAQLESLTPGVTIITDTVPYPDIAVGQTAIGLAPFGFSVDHSVACGSDIQFLCNRHGYFANLPAQLLRQRLDPVTAYRSAYL